MATPSRDSPNRRVPPGPVEVAVPAGTRLRLDRRARVLDDGDVLLGGAPPRMLYLAPGRAGAAADGHAHGRPTRPRPPSPAGCSTPGSRTRWQMPAAAAPAVAETTVVVPVKDRPAGLARLLAALPAGLGGRSSWSTTARPTRAASARSPIAAGARVLRHPRARGPAAARNTGLAAAGTPLVAFLDSDVVPEPGWLDPLLAALRRSGGRAGRAADRRPAAGHRLARAATRRCARRWTSARDPALVVPRSRVAYVPSAALVVRRAAVGAGFRRGLRVAEDVDLVLRLHAAGWRLRYVPAARVAHDHRTGFAAWWLRKAYYGTGAAPLAVRHRGAVPPMVLTPTSAADRRAAADRAAARRCRPRRPSAGWRPGGWPAGLRLRRPRATAGRLVALGALGAAGQTADAVTRHYWPLSLLAGLLSRRARRTVLAVALVEGPWTGGGTAIGTRGCGPIRPGYLLARRLDDLAYGAGLWWGAWRHRSWEPLRPVGPATPNRALRQD